jgi:hypothetical protein
MHVKELAPGQDEALVMEGARVAYVTASGDKGPRAVQVRIEANGHRAVQPEPGPAVAQVTLAEGLAGTRQAALALLEWVDATMAAARAQGIGV